jgi:hypothetical protein
MPSANLWPLSLPAHDTVSNRLTSYVSPEPILIPLPRRNGSTQQRLRIYGMFLHRGQVVVNNLPRRIDYILDTDTDEIVMVQTTKTPIHSVLVSRIPCSVVYAAFQGIRVLPEHLVTAMQAMRATDDTALPYGAARLLMEDFYDPQAFNTQAAPYSYVSPAVEVSDASVNDGTYSENLDITLDDDDSDNDDESYGEDDSEAYEAPF